MAYAEEITFALACVQTSPLPQKTHGGGTSVHRLPLHLEYFRLKNLSLNPEVKMIIKIKSCFN